MLQPSTHGSTFAANPVVCAGANYVIDKISDIEFLNEVNKKGAYLREKLEKLEGVKSVRGLGLMIGIELEKDNAKDISVKCVENGLLIITAKNLLRMLPPLNISYSEIDEAVEILNKTIQEDKN